MAQTFGASSSTTPPFTEYQRQHSYSYLGVVELSPSVAAVDNNQGPAEVEKSVISHLNGADQGGEPSTASGAQVEETLGVRSIEERIIDQLDYAQMCGDIKRQPSPDTQLVSVEVSTHGVKFLSANGDERAVERLAMHKIVQCLSYENEIGSCNVAIVMSRNDSAALTCHLLQTESHAEADNLCEQILSAFNQIEEEATEKVRDERERRRVELEQKRRQRKAQQ